MSLSATLYRIPEIDPEERRALATRPRFAWDAVKDSAIFEQTFWGLIFVLTKGQPQSTVELVEEIFSPPQMAEKGDFEDWVFGEDETPVRYLPPELVEQIDALLQSVSEADVHLRFDAEEMNRSGIYPGIWNEDDSGGQAFTASRVAEDLANLKAIFRTAAEEGDFIFAFVG
jgi:hypothetical protein